MSRATAYRLLLADVYELAGLSRRTSEHVARAHGRTAAQGHVLSVVSEKPAAVPAVARRLGLSRQAVQRVVNDLVTAGQLALDPDPDDRRSPLVRIEPAGAASLAAITRDGDHRRDQALSSADLTGEDLDAARAVVRRVLRALDASENDEG